MLSTAFIDNHVHIINFNLLINFKIVLGKSKIDINIQVTSLYMQPIKYYCPKDVMISIQFLQLSYKINGSLGEGEPQSTQLLFLQPVHCIQTPPILIHVVDWSLVFMGEQHYKYNILYSIYIYLTIRFYFAIVCMFSYRW